MFTPEQRRALERFAKSLATLSDDSLIDAYHQAWEDHRDARAEGSDNLDKACAESLVTKTAMWDRFPDYQSHYKARYPSTNSFPSPRPRSPRIDAKPQAPGIH
jgi:hypothetical protein